MFRLSGSLVAPVFATAILAATAGPGAARTAPVAPPAAPAIPAVGGFGIDLSGMDRTIRPGDDFYGYVNGKWMARTVIPADRADYGIFAELDTLSKNRTRKILEEMRADPASRPGIAYASYLDQKTVEAAGLGPITPWLDHVRRVTADTYPAVAGQAWRAGIGIPFLSFVAQNDKAPDQYALMLQQGGLGMPDRDYYLSDKESMAAVRAKYVAHLANVLTFIGEAQPQARAAAVFAFEKEIAAAHWTRVASRDATRTYNPTTLADLEKDAPGFSFRAMFAAENIDADHLIVAQPDAVASIARLIAAAPIAVLRDQLLIRSVDAYAEYLPDRIAAENFAFYGTVLSGTPEQRPRWKRAIDFAVGAVPDDVSRVYVARYFPPETRAAVEALVGNVIAAMGRRIDNLDWMEPATKRIARAKLAAFTTKIGYPDRWHDYSKLELAPRDLFGNAWRSNLFDFDDNAGKLGTPLRRWEWFMTPMTINAYANFSMNEIVFPAAILQPPFFDPKADPAVNYGAIGAVIGHEISHHFDDQGAKYNDNGKLASWWTKKDQAAFAARTAKLVEQYNAYEPFPGEHVNGALTLGENIGDLAGLTIAYDAWQASLNGATPPVIAGFSGKQRFFMSWAQVWRRKYRDADLHKRLLTDPHAPSRYRADIVRNFDAWYEAFGAAADGSLALPEDARVRIW